MIPPDMISYGIALPVALSAALLAVIARPWRRDNSARAQRTAALLAIALGYVAGHVGLFGWPAFPPVESWQWLVYLALTAGLVGVLAGLALIPDWLHRGLAWLLLAIAPWLLLKILLPAEWSTLHIRAWLGGFSIAFIAFWTSLDALARRRPGPAMPLILLITISAGSFVLLESANARLAQLAGVLAAAIVPALIVATWRPGVSLAGGAALVTGIVLCGLLATGHANNYGDVPAIAFVLIAAAPTLAWAAEFSALRRLKPWKALLLRLIPFLAAAGAAAMIAS